MKALVKKEARRGLWMEDIEKPAISANDLLVKVHKASVCGTDLHIYQWDAWAQKTIKTPTTLGHEFVGEVVEVGALVEGFSVGDRVATEGHITCGKCRNCRTTKRHLCNHVEGIGIQRDGGFAEFVSLPASNAFIVPNAISSDIASILDPLGNAIHTTLSFDLVGEDILITGAGPIGIMACAVARFAGARRVVITDINDYRLNLAKKLGATHTINVAQTDMANFMKDFDYLEGFDVALEMSGNPAALNTILKVLRPGCPIALLGILPENAPIDWHQVIFKGLTLKGIYGREMFDTWYKMAGMLLGGLDVDAVITHKFSADDYEKAFKAMEIGLCGKVILDWT